MVRNHALPKLRIGGSNARSAPQQGQAPSSPRARATASGCMVSPSASSRPCSSTSTSATKQRAPT